MNPPRPSVQEEEKRVTVATVRAELRLAVGDLRKVLDRIERIVDVEEGG